MTANQLLAQNTLFAAILKYRAKDFSQAPTDATYIASKGKFKGTTVLLVALSLIDSTFPDVVINEKGAYDMENVSSYPESKSAVCRYNDALPANALCACVYGDMHLAKLGYGRKTVIAVPVPKVEAKPDVLAQSAGLATV